MINKEDESFLEEVSGEGITVFVADAIDAALSKDDPNLKPCSMFLASHAIAAVRAYDALKLQKESPKASTETATNDFGSVGRS